MKRVILVILDGFGYRASLEGNAVASAHTPNIDRFIRDYPNTLIGASGRAVGLPQGQMGNSEVGHLNIGAGRIVYQEITRIDRAIENGEFRRNQALLDLMQGLKSKQALHLMGLLSDGCVHSSMQHLYELLRMAKEFELRNVYIHAYTDGRDTPPHSGINFIRELEDFMHREEIGQIATVCGRYYAMDRDNRWERIKLAYDALVKGEGLKFNSPVEAIDYSYSRGITDEFVNPSVIMSDGEPRGLIREGDAVIFFNFRADRARQLTRALAENDFSYFLREIDPVRVLTLTQYDEEFENVDVAFKPFKMTNILGETVANAGLRQLRIAETEKYPHVTFFFNGGEEREFKYEERKLIPSPKVATYDLQPAMSAYEVTAEVLKALNGVKYDLIVLNYANCDMVGHTGVFDAAVKAVETVDDCSGKVYERALSNGWTMLLTADHGNAEMMIDTDGEPFTAHTTNPVRFIYIDEKHRPQLRQDGALCHIAPTILNILGLKIPAEMEGPMTVE